VLFLHERLTLLQALGAVLAIVAAILLSIEAPPTAAAPESQKPASSL
jgi:drug/metabolite transporter (DMT)-like permease